MAGRLRERATVVVIRSGRVLLVRDVGPVFAMPGGGIEPGESPEAAAVRELREETGLAATRVAPLFVWESAIHRHHVFLAEANGEVEIGQEVSEFRWWDHHMEALPTHSHVEAILERLSISAGREIRIRRRATAIVMRDERLLLLREPEDTEFGLPGGGVEDDEPPSLAVVRELLEETGLAASRVAYLFDYYEFWDTDNPLAPVVHQGYHYWGQVHNVFRVDADGEVILSAEHCEFTWWDGIADLPVWSGVKDMLSTASQASTNPPADAVGAGLRPAQPLDRFAARSE